MPEEIERKFLVASDAWRSRATGVRYRQGYLSSRPECTVRVRLVGERAWLTVKGIAVGARRPEFEYEIPAHEGRQLLEQLCERPLIDKTRYRVPYAGTIWEVDEFHAENEGLVVAEVELEDEAQDFERPPWLGLEVTSDARYANASLVRAPYRQWRDSG